MNLNEQYLENMKQAKRYFSLFSIMLLIAGIFYLYDYETDWAFMDFAWSTAFRFGAGLCCLYYDKRKKHLTFTSFLSACFAVIMMITLTILPKSVKLRSV